MAFSERGFYAIHKAAFGARLSQDAMCSGFPDACPCSGVGQCCKEDDRKAVPGFQKAAMQFEPVNFRHHDVDDSAAYGIAKADPVEERASGFKGSHVIAEGSEETRRCLPHSRVVVDQGDHSQGRQSLLTSE